jgi:hypothetical protein
MFADTVITPLKWAGSHIKTGAVTLSYSPSVDGTTWTFQMWLARLGGLTWAGNNFATPTDGL